MRRNLLRGALPGVVASRAVALGAGRAMAACSLETLLEIPVTMSELQPVVAARGRLSWG